MHAKIVKVEEQYSPFRRVRLHLENGEFIDLVRSHWGMDEHRGPDWWVPTEGSFMILTEDSHEHAVLVGPPEGPADMPQYFGKEWREKV